MKERLDVLLVKRNLAASRDISAFVIFPLSMASRMACRFVPPPETSTPTFNIKSLLFHLLRYVRLHMEYRLLL